MTKMTKDLLDVLVCPKCQGKVRLADDNSGLECQNCNLLYVINDDIPIMLIDSAKPLKK